MAEEHKVKITVLRRFDPSEVFETSPVTLLKPIGKCELFRDGQEFIVEKGRMPQGFCGSAWHTIYPNVRTLTFGGDLPFHKETDTAINCCQDGLRPVVFKLQRI